MILFFIKKKGTSKTIRPAGAPSILMSKKTLAFLAAEAVVEKNLPKVLNMRCIQKIKKIFLFSVFEFNKKAFFSKLNI